MSKENYFYIDGKKIPMSEETAKSILDSQKQLTYKDIAKKLFWNKKTYYIDFRTINSIEKLVTSLTDSNNSTNKKQSESILTLNKLCNVAKYLNDEWLPNWNDGNAKYFIQITPSEEIQVNSMYSNKGSDVYFKSRELTQQAIDILGEDEIRKALTLNH